MLYNVPAMIAANVARILEELPPGIELVAAAKSQPANKVLEAVAAGIRIIGENYVQDAVAHFAAIGSRVRWHFIGHLQKNKAKKAAEIFDMIETVDSPELGAELDKRCAALGKTLPVLIEINSGREPQKAGVFPERAEGLARELGAFGNLRVEGLMTMGPFEGDPEDARPYFRETRAVFDALRVLAIPGVSMIRLSMGMTNSYRVALEEGATMVRIGTKIFGPRG
jgi:pyridoxal phosphate enzyme (YggS family)